jgi:hypothetical protein
MNHRRCAPLCALVTAVAVAGALAAGAPASPQPIHDAKGRGATGLHGVRYCEIFVLSGALPAVTVKVYNTIGLSRCPSAQWKAFDANELKTELGAIGIVLNGPRHWLMDSAFTPAPGPVRRFHAMRLRLVAKLKITTAAGLVQTPYTPRTIYRDNTFTWDKGRTVYELVAPDGTRYVMQAYSQIVDPHLKAAALPRLGRRIRPPAGWHYRVRVLRHPIVLTTTAAHKPAVIVQDELQNTYQREG